jgi:hypothetical protein
LEQSFEFSSEYRDDDDVLVATLDSDDATSDAQTLSNDKTEDEEESYDGNGDDANVADTKPNSGATRAIGRWILEEDAKLTGAVANTSKMWWGKEYKTDWVAIAALIPGRTKRQC